MAKWKERITPPPLNDEPLRIVASDAVRSARRSYLDAVKELRDAVGGSHDDDATSTRARSSRNRRATRDHPALRSRGA